MEVMSIKKEQMENHKIHNALTSIASEIQRFQDSKLPEQTPTESSDIEKILADLMKCKSKLNSRRARICKLKRNLKTACFVAKKVASAKEKQSESNNKRLTTAQSECAHLLEKFTKHSEINNNLLKDNEKLQQKLNIIVNYINLGYSELQRIRRESSEDAPVLSQLRKLIMCCGEYYADYCNEHNKYLQTKHRCDFLENKISILENHVDIISEQLKTIQFSKDRLQKQNAFMKDKLGSEFTLKNLKARHSELIKTEANKATIDFIKRETGDHRQGFDQIFDFSSHVSIVKKLLSDQDALLKDLKIISQEFSVSKKYEFSRSSCSKI